MTTQAPPGETPARGTTRSRLLIAASIAAGLALGYAAGSRTSARPAIEAGERLGAALDGAGEDGKREIARLGGLEVRLSELERAGAGPTPAGALP